MVKQYFCKSEILGTETRDFNQWHKAEIENRSARGINARNIPAKISRGQALELVNKWNRMSSHSSVVGGAKFWI